jgi:protein-disulfide isomerase
VWLTLAVAACGGNTSPSAPAPTPTTPLPKLDDMLAEKVMGDPAAPVTMIEYSSLTCSHCGDFNVITLPLLKATYIDTSRMKLVYRDFPLDNGAMSASMVARCSGDRFFTVIGRLYEQQNTWSLSADVTAGLKKVVAPLGMTSDDVDACLADGDLRNGILGIRNAGAQQFGVNATPTFIVNGRVIVGALSYAEFDAVIKAALGG